MKRFSAVQDQSAGFEEPPPFPHGFLNGNEGAQFVFSAVLQKMPPHFFFGFRAVRMGDDVDQRFRRIFRAQGADGGKKTVFAAQLKPASALTDKFFESRIKSLT